VTDNRSTLVLVRGIADMTGVVPDLCVNSRPVWE
jgi:hypothetical protein